MVSAGCTKYEDDVHKMMEKVVEKEVQLQYSGCGRKIKGVGKKSFRETETYQIMESKLMLNYAYFNMKCVLTIIIIVSEFILAKYQKSDKKISVITAVSYFLAGAKDRKGGRSQRNK